jgi:hypothetical protein
MQDLHDLSILAHSVHSQWTALGLAARALRDREFETACTEMSHESERQTAWLRTRLHSASSQALIVPSF